MCNHAEVRSLLVQQGGSKDMIPLALDVVSALARIGITQPMHSLVGVHVMWAGLHFYCWIHNLRDWRTFESLMALLNLGSLNKSIRKRILKNGNCIQAIENYMFEEHQLTRCDGENDKVRI